MYNADVEEAEGVPMVVEDLKNLIASADGLLMVTPENNNSIPGVLTNQCQGRGGKSHDGHVKYSKDLRKETLK